MMGFSSFGVTKVTLNVGKGRFSWLFFIGVHQNKTPILPKYHSFINLNICKTVVKNCKICSFMRTF